MYIEYITPQRVADPNIAEDPSEGGLYRPTWLIRTSDWQRVPGTDAVGGYHALSYCWEQSGEIMIHENGECVCVDDGLHEITSENDGGVNNRQVTYEEVLQQVCRDFDIDYLWYDKSCIDQTNRAEKHREIRQMHLIYSNARYTVALVPEINIADPQDFDRMNWVYRTTEAKCKAFVQMVESLWFQRSWTLEEVMMSTRILVVGRNTHIWSLADIKQGDRNKENDLLTSTMLGFKKRTMKSANQVLRHAHFRTSTKEHDKIFALANIFAEITSVDDIDYGRDVSAAMTTFYRRLAQRDLSLMCFGSILFPNGSPMFLTTMRPYDLPSWTGVAGLHTLKPVVDITLDQNGDYTIDKNRVLNMRCRYHSIRPRKYNNLNAFQGDERKKKADGNMYRVVSSMDDFDGGENEALDWSYWTMLRETHCHSTHYYTPTNQDRFPSPVLPLSLTEECDECVILGLVFDSATETVADDDVFVGYRHSYLSPVAKKTMDGASYKIIGVVLWKCFQYNERRISPQEIMDKVFDGSDTCAFAIM